MDEEQISGTLAVFGSIFAFKALTYIPIIEKFINENAIWVVFLALTLVAFHNKLGRWIKRKLI